MTYLIRAFSIIFLLAGSSAWAEEGGTKTLVIPTIDVVKENIGSGQRITLTIKDLRAEKTVGFKRKNDKLEPIPSAQDISDIIYYQLIEALKAKGFVVDNGAGPNAPLLTLQINTLKYVVQTNFLTKDLEINTNLKAIASYEGHVLSKGYQLEKTAKDFSLGGKDRELKRMTQTVSAALTELVNDRQVLNALKGDYSGAPANDPAAPSNAPSNMGSDRPPAVSNAIESQPLGPN